MEGRAIWISLRWIWILLHRALILLCRILVLLRLTWRTARSRRRAERFRQMAIGRSISDRLAASFCERYRGHKPLLFTGSGAFPRFWFAVILVAGRRSGFSPLEGSHFLMTRWRKGTGEGADAPSVRGRAGRARRASWRRGPPRDDRPRRPGARLWRFR
jgi:hypothetical protein